MAICTTCVYGHTTVNKCEPLPSLSKAGQCLGAMFASDHMDSVRHNKTIGGILLSFAVQFA